MGCLADEVLSVPRGGCSFCINVESAVKALQLEAELILITVLRVRSRVCQRGGQQKLLAQFHQRLRQVLAKAARCGSQWNCSLISMKFCSRIQVEAMFELLVAYKRANLKKKTKKNYLQVVLVCDPRYS